MGREFDRVVERRTWPCPRHLQFDAGGVFSELFFMSYVYIALTIIFTVYGQLILKWQLGRLGGVPAELSAKLLFFAKSFVDPWLMSGLFSAYLASLAWMSAVSKLNLSHAYPFMSLSFVLVMFLSALFFSEPLTWPKVVGMVFIIAGIVIGSQG